MRILVASHTYITDLNREKLRELANLEPEIEVTVVVPRRWNPGGVQNRIVEPKAQQEGTFRVVPIQNFSENNQGALTFGLEIVSLLREFRPQIIQVEQGAKSLAYAELILLNRLLGLQAKMVFFTWWNLPYQNKFPISVLENFNLSQTQGLIAGNQDGAEIYRDHGYTGPIKVLPQLGIDETLFTPTDESTLRSQLGISSDRFVVGFVGRFVPEKGILTLLEAVKALSGDWQLLLLGRGELEQQILDTADQAGIRERLTLIQSVPHTEVARYINLMDTLVLPSETTYQFKTLTAVGWKEQFGHVIIEAMGCRVPVVGSDSGEIPHVIGEAGMVFPEGNADELRDALQQLMSDAVSRETIAEAGYQKAQQQYTNKALATEQLAFYRELLA